MRFLGARENPMQKLCSINALETKAIPYDIINAETPRPLLVKSHPKSAKIPM